MKPNVKIFAYDLLANLFFAAAVSMWLIFCVSILVLIAGPSAISKNGMLIFTISLVPVFMTSLLGNFLVNNIIRQAFDSIRNKNETEAKADLTKRFITAHKINKLTLIYLVASGFFARVFSGDLVALFVVISIVSAVVLFKKISESNVLVGV